MRSLLLAVLLVSAVSAQPSNWELPTDGTTVSIEADRPFFTEGNPYEGLTSAWTLSTTQPVGPLLRIVGDLPIAVGATSGETSVALGNLQVGVEADLPTSPVTLGGYLRVPTSTESGDRTRAQLVGVFTDYEQIGAYVNDFVTLSGLAETRFDLGAPGLSVRLRAIPQLLVATDDTAGDQTEAFIGYAAQLLFDNGAARLGGGLTGLTPLTEEGDETQLFVGVMADVAAGPVRPGLVVRAPISGDLVEFLDTVVGVRVTVPFD